MEELKNKWITLGIEDWGRSHSGEASYLELDGDTLAIKEMYDALEEKIYTHSKGYSLKNFVRNNSDGYILIMEKDSGDVVLNAMISGDSWDLIDELSSEFEKYEASSSSLNDDFKDKIKNVFSDAYFQF
jgi:hypothetical protein